MFKHTLAVALIISISGCNTDFLNPQPIKWATVDSSKLSNVIGKQIKTANPYPDELNYQETRRERANVSELIDDITRASTAKCEEKAASTDDENRKRIQAQAAGVIIPPRPHAIRLHQLQGNSEFHTCMAEAKKDPLLADLKNKLLKIDETYTARQEHEQLLREKTDKYINEVISTYAEQNNYELVISKNSSTIAYNKSQVVLDITDAVLASTSGQPQQTQ